MQGSMVDTAARGLGLRGVAGMTGGLRPALRAADGDEGVRAVVLTGAGTASLPAGTSGRCGTRRSSRSV